MTTKEQERKALERIRKIVADLGENSYISYAFEGCFEKAEENIDGDMACSWKSVAESKEGDIARLQMNLAAANREKAALVKKNDELNAELAELKGKKLKPHTLSTMKILLKQEIEAAEKATAAAADRIVAQAETPECEQFKQAVEDHRRNFNAALAYKNALADIEKQ